MAHVFLAEPDGVVLRSHFWLGAAIRPYLPAPLAAPVARALDNRLVRRLSLPLTCRVRSPITVPRSTRTSPRCCRSCTGASGPPADRGRCGEGLGIICRRAHRFDLRRTVLCPGPGRAARARRGRGRRAAARRPGPGPARRAAGGAGAQRGPDRCRRRPGVERGTLAADHLAQPRHAAPGSQRGLPAAARADHAAAAHLAQPAAVPGGRASRCGRARRRDDRAGAGGGGPADPFAAARTARLRPACRPRARR